MSGKSKFLKKAALSSFFAATAFGAHAQLSNTLYFDQNNLRQHYVNPASQPIGKFYIGMPALSTIAVSGGNSDVAFQDIFYNIKRDGKNVTTLFFDKDVNKTKDFLDLMSGQERVFASYRLNLIDFGFRTHERNYITFGIANRMETAAFMPESFSHFAFEGMKNGQSYNFDADKLSVSSTVFTEFALGFSRKVTEQLEVGAKLKYLYGHANVVTDFSDLKLYGSEDKWYIKGDASIHGAVPGLEIVEDEDHKVDDVDFNDDLDVSEYVKPQGGGFAVDLGANYQLLPQLKLSASLVDFGFIHWKKNLVQLDKTNDFVYDGIDYDINKPDDDYYDEYGDMLEDMYRVNNKPDKYFTHLTSKVYLGGEYSFWDNRLGLGALSKTYFYRGNVWEDFLVSANFRPWKQLSATLTYNLFDKEWNNLGAAINLNAGPVNLWVAFDHIPLKFAKSDDIMFPSNIRNFRANLGLAFLFGYGKDKPNKNMTDLNQELAYAEPIIDQDEDGVPDSKDKCPDTPVEAKVDSTGCPVDTDGDGVADYLDKCPATPAGVKVDSTGCPIDTDGDGVADYLDKCPDTPAEAAGKVDSTGCPLDTDGDGIADYLDKCPTVPGVKSNNGCPEVKASVKQIFKKALNGIQFESGKAKIKSSSNGILNQIVKIMKENPTYKLSIAGHTDNTGDPTKNMKLSQDRADAVKTYLVSKGVDESRLQTAGYGDTKPIASNAKPAGRALNRRVEFEVEFEQMVEAE